MPIESGFKLEDAAVDRYKDMKSGSKSIRFILLKLNKETGAIVIDEECKKTDEDQKKDFEQMLTHLKQTEGRFVLLDLEAKRANGASADQLFFICWNPDSSHVNSKTLYSSGRQNVIDVLKLTSTICIQANDYDDLDFDELMKKAKR